MVHLGSATVYMIESFIGRAREEPQRSGHLNLISLVFIDFQLKPEQLTDNRLPRKGIHAGNAREYGELGRFWKGNRPWLAFLL